MASRFAVPWTTAADASLFVGWATVGVDILRSPKETKISAELDSVEHHIGRRCSGNERAARRDRYYNQVFDVKTLREFSTG